MLSEQPCWRLRSLQIPRAFDDIQLPEIDRGSTRQDEEWADVVVDGRARRIRFHDYGEVYAVPGLYEALFYQRLRCCSPSRVVAMLAEVLQEHGVAPEDLGVLDVGAGNGMVGDELALLGVETIVGIDIYPEARDAAERDRPGIYAAYHVADLTRLSPEAEADLRGRGLNALTIVGALGFGDIPPQAFVKAMDLIDSHGWLAYNINEDFLEEDHAASFSALVDELRRDRVIQVHYYRRYQHRISVAGEPLYYAAAIARKLRDIPAGTAQRWS